MKFWSVTAKQSGPPSPSSTLCSLPQVMQRRVAGSKEQERNWFTVTPFFSMRAPLKQSLISGSNCLSKVPILSHSALGVNIAKIYLFLIRYLFVRVLIGTTVGAGVAREEIIHLIGGG